MSLAKSDRAVSGMPPHSVSLQISYTVLGKCRSVLLSITFPQCLINLDKEQGNRRVPFLGSVGAGNGSPTE
jgi:hypothetical protein